jgi:dihydrofolate reductase
MANILYMTVSRDGYIAGTSDETPWNEASWDAFEQFVQSCDMVLLGRRTYEIMDTNSEFVEGPEYVVVTSDKKLDTKGLRKIPIESALDMPEANQVGIIGGGELNGRLANLGVIQEIFLDIEPVDLYEGIKLFGTYGPQLKLEYLGSQKIGEAGVLRHYKVLPE